jgi:hypothetical protein
VTLPGIEAIGVATQREINEKLVWAFIGSEARGERKPSILLNLSLGGGDGA